jgi:actin-related protein
LTKCYEFPDGSGITARQERFRCPEALFRPDFLGLDTLAIHDCIFKSIMECDCDIRQEMYKNVVISGGSTMFHGIAERLHQELVNAAPPNMKIRVTNSL